jgi:hypothetical protein
MPFGVELSPGSSAEFPDGKRRNLLPELSPMPVRHDRRVRDVLRGDLIQPAGAIRRLPCPSGPLMLFGT